MAEALGEEAPLENGGGPIRAPLENGDGSFAMVGGADSVDLFAALEAQLENLEFTPEEQREQMDSADAQLDSHGIKYNSVLIVEYIERKWLAFIREHGAAADQVRHTDGMATLLWL